MKKQWYKTKWGIIAIVLLFPLFLMGYLTKLIWKQNWSKRTRIIALSALWGTVLIYGMFVNYQEEHTLKDCLTPDGKTQKISERACIELTTNWNKTHKPTIVQQTDNSSTPPITSPQVNSPTNTPEPTKTPTNTPKPQNPDEKLESICNKYGGLDNCIVTKENNGKWSVVQIMQYESDFMMFSLAKQNSRDFIFAIYATKLPISHVAISNNYYAGKKYYRAGLGADVASTQPDTTWTNNEVGPTIFYDFLKSHTNGESGDRQNSTYVETNLD